MADPDRVARIMWPLRNRGVCLAIDISVRAITNFASITRLPFDVFKIDQQFVRAKPTDPHAPAIVEMILAMAEALGQETVAEVLHQLNRQTSCCAAPAPLVRGTTTHLLAGRCRILMRCAQLPSKTGGTGLRRSFCGMHIVIPGRPRKPEGLSGETRDPTGERADVCRCSGLPLRRPG